MSHSERRTDALAKSCARARASGNYHTVTRLTFIATVLTPSCGQVELHATARAPVDSGVERHTFVEDFDTFDASRWSCEGHCPSVVDGVASFSLVPRIAPGEADSWSKVAYREHTFTSGTFTVRFALGAQPEEQVWWGFALWDPGPIADEAQYSEINVGFTTDGTSAPTQLDFVSARLGHKLALRVDTGRPLYDGAFHEARLEYTPTALALYIDDSLVETIRDPSVIPDGPLELILGTRLVAAPALTASFGMQIDQCKVEW